jgi:hypothetical protein
MMLTLLPGCRHSPGHCFEKDDSADPFHRNDVYNYTIVHVKALVHFREIRAIRGFRVEVEG